MQGFRSYSVSSHQTLHSIHSYLGRICCIWKTPKNKASLRIKPSSPAGANNLTLLNNFPHLHYAKLGLATSTSNCLKDLHLRIQLIMVLKGSRNAKEGHPVRTQRSHLHNISTCTYNRCNQAVHIWFKM
jgi:hypothetical protein